MHSAFLDVVYKTTNPVKTVPSMKTIFQALLEYGEIYAAATHAHSFLPAMEYFALRTVIQAGWVSL